MLSFTRQCRAIIQVRWKTYTPVWQIYSKQYTPNFIRIGWFRLRYDKNILVCFKQYTPNFIRIGWFRLRYDKNILVCFISVRYVSLSVDFQPLQTAAVTGQSAAIWHSLAHSQMRVYVIYRVGQKTGLFLTVCNSRTC